MSALRNAVQRRPHRERAQPLERQRLGLLEKHKDYSQRAKDYNKKKKQLKSLRQKANDRNEDEFYYGMLSRSGPGSRIMDGKGWTGTINGDRGNKRMDVDTVRLLKTQDLGYVRTMKQMTVKEVAKLQEQVVMARGLNRLDDVDDEEMDDDDEDDEDDMPMPQRPRPARKIVFMDDEDERDQVVDGGMAGGMDEDGDDDEPDAPIDDVDQDGESEREKNLRRLTRRLAHARQKLKALSDAETALEVQKAKMAKTATSGGFTKKGDKIMVRARKR